MSDRAIAEVLGLVTLLAGVLTGYAISAVWNGDSSAGQNFAVVSYTSGAFVIATILLGIAALFFAVRERDGELRYRDVDYGARNDDDDR